MGDDDRRLVADPWREFDVLLTHYSSGCQSRPRMMRRSVFTVGHSTRSVADLVELLDAFGIRQIVDVRSIPKSRHNPQFNREALLLSLKEKRVRYKYMKELGGLLP